MTLTRRVALVTGAARGIGRRTASVLAEEGAAIAVADVLPTVETVAEELRKTGAVAAAAIFDIVDPVQVRQGVANLRSELGDIDILVNNAGIVANIARITKMTHEAWQREIEVNLGGAFNMIKETIGPMVEKKWGRIVNVSSLGASGGLHKQVAYAASKSGLLGLTKTVTLEHARDGITCNAILPGLIETELVQMMPNEILEAAKKYIPARRIGTMDEVARLIAFLASDQAGFINGAEIHIDGGMRLNVSILGSRRELKETIG
jgi:NAD(P)-dependent dehydrogenase (short-subunit alcohol dehydrogenase family)